MSEEVEFHKLSDSGLGLSEDTNGNLLLHAFDETTRAWKPLEPSGVMSGMTILARENLKLQREVRRLTTKFDNFRADVLATVERNAPKE